MRIAIVDDCENERNELCKRLSQSSFSRSYDIEICGYGNGTDFLNEAMQNRFDLVFMDIYMENENGIDVCLFSQPHQPTTHLKVLGFGHCTIL